MELIDLIRDKADPDQIDSEAGEHTKHDEAIVIVLSIIVTRQKTRLFDKYDQNHDCPQKRVQKEGLYGNSKGQESKGRSSRGKVINVQNS